jgi:hypothetical protein
MSLLKIGLYGRFVQGERRAGLAASARRLAHYPRYRVALLA